MKNIIAVVVGLVAMALAIGATIFIFTILVTIAGSPDDAVAIIAGVVILFLIVKIALHIGQDIVEWFKKNVLGTGAYK